MIKLNIKGQVVMIPMTQDELTERVAKASAFIKTMTGIGNNAAWSCCLEAMDYLRKHPRYRQKVKQQFKSAMEAFKDYERQLIYTSENRLFHLDDLTPEYRKRYGDISDREYYDFWASTGASAYTQKRVWITNLWNKFRLSLRAHNVPNIEAVAWGMTADACLKLAVCIYENCITSVTADYDVPAPLLDVIFGQLNIAEIGNRWDKALLDLEPFTEAYDLTPLEQRNIQLGLNQLQEEWTSIATLAGSLTDTIEAFDDVFRTKSEQKKALRQVAEIRE